MAGQITSLKGMLSVKVSRFKLEAVMFIYPLPLFFKSIGLAIPEKLLIIPLVPKLELGNQILVNQTPAHRRREPSGLHPMRLPGKLHKVVVHIVNQSKHGIKSVYTTFFSQGIYNSINVSR